MHYVIRSHFNDLRRKKGAAEGRDITMQNVADETHLSFPTVQRVASGNGQKLAGVKLGTIDVLASYFGVGIGDVIERIAD